MLLVFKTLVPLDHSNITFPDHCLRHAFLLIFSLNYLPLRRPCLTLQRKGGFRVFLKQWTIKSNKVCRFYHGCATPSTSLVVNNSPSAGFLFWTAGTSSDNPLILISLQFFELIPLTIVNFTRLKLALENMEISELFSVQVALWQETIGPGNFERDLCINSPTGSGKTLAYALPIVQKLLPTSTVKCLRALVVVPTRDLALQVKQVFDAIALPLGLRVGLAVGQSSVADEISSLIYLPGEEEGVDPGFLSPFWFQSKVDILVATPGRLVDHVNLSRGFTLKHLHYLVSREISYFTLFN